MKWMDALEKRFGNWALPNLTLYLIGFQLIGIVLLLGHYVPVQDLVLTGGLVEVGQWWRLLSFMMIPRTLNPIWLFFSIYIFYLMGSALEREWGTFRYNLFILIGYLLTIASAFLVPTAYITNMYFLGSVFLAFATLFPNFELHLFFILPVKIKWLGILTAVLYAMTFFGGDPGSRLCVMAVFVNYILFFGKDFLHRVKMGQRRQAYQAKQKVQEDAAFHQCAQCGISDKSHPGTDFRYCSECGRCYCEAHIGNHTHSSD